MTLDLKDNKQMADQYRTTQELFDEVFGETPKEGFDDFVDAVVRTELEYLKGMNDIYEWTKR